MSPQSAVPPQSSWIQFSSTDPSAPGSSGVSGSQSLSDARKARKVQVIEDLRLVQDLLRHLIEEPGVYEVCAISSTETGAVNDFEAHQPDAVIIDLNLQQGSGLGFLRQIRSRGLSRRPVLIVVTNHAIAALEIACRSAGADHFLDKSRDLGKLRGVLDGSFTAPPIDFEGEGRRLN